MDEPQSCRSRGIALRSAFQSLRRNPLAAIDRDVQSTGTEQE